MLRRATTSTGTSIFRRFASTMIQVGDTFPKGSDPGLQVQIKFKENHTMESLLKDKKVLLVTLPGAFTPT